MIIDVLLLLVLILVNGVFAMSEIAIVSSRRARLVQLAETGSSGARHALTLASEPTRFLSSVQVGITSIGILNGAIGEASIASRLRGWMEQAPFVAPYAESLSLAIMVVLLTYFSLILGELVPKRLALTHPEAIASIIARPMDVLATVGRPIVRLLSLSTDGILGLFGVRYSKSPGVTVDEIRVMLAQGAEEGVVERSEHEMVTNVLNLDDRHVGAVLTPRSDVVFLDVRDSIEVNREKVRQDPHMVLPLCESGLDHVLGFVRSTKLLDALVEGQTVDLAALVEPTLFVPETMTLMKLLEQFKRTHLPVALVVDEFGDVEGLVSLTDVVSAIVGDLPTQAGEEPLIVRRDDGSWLMDGGLDLDTVVRTIDADSLLGDEDRQHYHTLGGLAMLALGRVPKTGDVFKKGEYRFEVVDMDGNRVDRVLISRAPSGGSAEGRQGPRPDEGR
jgi:putative hemolysin